MFTTLLLLSTSSLVSYADITCNSVELYGDESDGNSLEFAIPEYVCMKKSHNEGTLQESRNWVCDEDGGYDMQIFDNLHCFGTPTTIEDPCYDYGANCSYIAHCGGEICSYISMERWEGITQCGDDDVPHGAYINYTSTALVLGDSCQENEGSFTKLTCAESTVSFAIWQSYDCVGVPLSENVLWETECDERYDTAAIVDCDRVAVVPSYSDSVSDESDSAAYITTTDITATDSDSASDDSDDMDWSSSEDEDSDNSDDDSYNSNDYKPDKAEAHEDVYNDGLYDNSDVDHAFWSKSVMFYYVIGVLAALAAVALLVGTASHVYKKRRHQRGGHMLVSGCDEEDKSENVEMSECTETVQIIESLSY